MDYIWVLVLLAILALVVVIGVLRARTGTYGPVWLMLGILLVTAASCFLFPTPGGGLHGVVDNLGALLAITGLLSLAAALAVGTFAGWICLPVTGGDAKERRHRDFYPDVILTGLVAIALRLIA